MTRKTQIGLSAAAALLGLALVTALWLTHDTGTPPDDTPSQAHSDQPPGAAGSTAKEEPADPHVLGLIRDAYQESLAGNSPPGMVELMQGPAAGQPGTAPPAADPFVIPTGYRPDAGPAADLPPLPPDLAVKQQALSPPAKAPATGKAPKEVDPAIDLPPLPPLPPGTSR